MEKMLGTQPLDLLPMWSIYILTVMALFLHELWLIAEKVAIQNQTPTVAL
jgi:hypothetical protein